MRRITLLFGTVSVLSVGAIALVVACGDDDSSGSAAANTPDGAAGETGAATSSSGASSGASGSSGASSSSGGPSDGGASSSSGDLASNPAQYTCGTMTCDAGFAGGGNGPNVCCQAANGTDTKCSSSKNCDNTGSNGNLRLTCDETADCAGGPGGGGICCYVKEQAGGGGQPSFAASCLSRFECRTFQPGSGAKPRPQLCKTSAECGDAGVCNPKTCDGFKLHVCGSPDGCQ